MWEADRLRRDAVGVGLGEEEMVRAEVRWNSPRSAMRVQRPWASGMATWARDGVGGEGADWLVNHNCFSQMETNDN